MTMYAELWVGECTSIRKLKHGLTTDDLFGFLTTEPNAEAEPIHLKTMPAILVEPDGCNTWLTAEWREARNLQRPRGDGMLQLVPATPR